MLRLLSCFPLLLIIASSATAADLSELRGLVNEKQYGPAVVAGEQLLKEKPADRDTLFLTAYATQMAGQTDRATALYRQLINLYPELPEPRNNLAIILMEQEKYQEAARLLVEALNTHPSYATSYRNLNEIYKGIASQAYQRAVNEQQDTASLNGTIQLDTIAQIEPSSSTTQLAALNTDNASSTDVSAIEESNIEETIAGSPAVDNTAVIETAKTEEPVAEVAAVEPIEPQEIQVEETATTIEVAAATPAVAQEASTVETEPVDSVPTAATAQNVETVAVLTPPVESIEIPEKPRSIDEILEERIIDWASAWSNKAFDNYIGFYTSDHSPRFESHSAWVEHRRERIMRPGDINVEVSNIQIRARSENRAVIDFEQRYESSNYRDKVVKRIVMGRFDKEWKITAERVLSVL